LLNRKQALSASFASAVVSSFTDINFEQEGCARLNAAHTGALEEVIE